MKQTLAKWLFRRTGAERIHIVGCSRSGTTMLHAAMSGFQNVLLNPAESRPRYPGLRRAFGMSGQYRALGAKPGEPRFFVTKRHYAWFQQAEVDALVQQVLAEDIGVILIVRDPRDVILSRHARSDLDHYVTPEHWRLSILAGEQLQHAVERRVKFLTLRYEDVVLKPEETQAALERTFGLKIRPGARIDRVKDNLERSGLALQSYMTAAMQGVRNADPTSIGKWRRGKDNPEGQLLADAEAAPVYHAFLKRHGYAPAETGAEAAGVR